MLFWKPPPAPSSKYSNFILAHMILLLLHLIILWPTMRAKAPFNLRVDATLKLLWAQPKLNSVPFSIQVFILAQTLRAKALHWTL